MIREFILLLGFTLSQTTSEYLKEVYLYKKHKIVLEYNTSSNEWYVKLCISNENLNGYVL